MLKGLRESEAEMPTLLWHLLRAAVVSLLQPLHQKQAKREHYKEQVLFPMLSVWNKTLNSM